MDPEDLLLLVTRAMPFGKYKGRLIADLPGDYLRWFVREGVPKGEIGRLLALMHEIDHNGLSDLLKSQPNVDAATQDMIAELSAPRLHRSP
jgi:hypothetical protein